MAAGMSPDTVGKLLLGKSRHLRSDHIAALAKVLDCDEAWLLGSTPSPASELRPARLAPAPPGGGVAYGGIAEAGAFRPVNIFDQEAEHRRLPIAPDARFPPADQAAFEIMGDSMTEAGLHPGMWALAVDVHAWHRRMGEPGDGSLVVVARTRNGNPEREITVKRLRIFRDRIELRPESANPVHQPVVLPRQPAGDGGPETDGTGATVQILAVVLQAIRLF